MRRIKAQIYRDGTSQGDRRQRALDPDYVAVEERSIVDWIESTQSFAKHLTYFNDRNLPDGDWSSFFAGDADELANLLESLEEDKAIAKSVSPHLALFLTFLKLLRYPQQQFKDLTKRRLDFYYRQVLQLKEKAAQPDRAHVVFSLAPDRTEYLLPAGTELSAGNDESGNELQYVTDADLFVTQAQVASIKTLSVEKTYIDLETIHRQHNRTDRGFENMLRWALGRPQGDALPPPAWNTDGEIFTVILELFAQIKNLTVDRVQREYQDYILNKLCFATLDEFKFCLDAHVRENSTLENESEATQAPTEVEWQQVYRLIEKAYRKKINQDRRDRLKQEHQGSELDSSEAFLKLWRFALGDPLSGDPLPFYRKQAEVDLDELLQEVNSDRPEAERFIQEELFLSVADFSKIMAVRETAKAEPQKWNEVYRLLERAQTKKRDFAYPPIGRTEVNGIHAQAIADAKPNQPLTINRFHPFVAPANSSTVQSLGIAIASPVLHLQEGTREITVTIACDAETFDRSKLANFDPQKSLAVAISSDRGWLTIKPEQLSWASGDFFLESALKSFEADNLSLIYQITGVTFDDDDIEDYLQFADGSLYRIDVVLDDGLVQLSSVGLLEPTGKVLKYASLNLSNGSTLNNASLEDKTNLIEIATDNNSFQQEDADKFIVWTDGKIYQIKEFINARKVGVIYWGYLPASSTNKVKKYEQIAFASRVTEISGELKPIKIISSNDAEFVREDRHTLLAWVSGEVYQITGLVGDREALVKSVGRVKRSLNPNATVNLYSASGIYLNSIQIKITLDDTQPSIIPLPDGDDFTVFNTIDPIIKIGFHGNDNYYKTFKDLCLSKVNVQVAVTDLKDLQLRNDRAVLSAKSPFEPFSFPPAIGNSFYFAHPEIIVKPLDSLSLTVQWIGLPKGFKIHYAAYQELAPDLNNNSFKAKLELFLNRSWHEVGERSLFETDETGNLLSTANLNYDRAAFYGIPNYSYTSPLSEPTADDLLEQSRYFRLELIRPGFQHDIYPLVLNKAARKSEADAVYPPYTPKIKSIAIAYQASAEIDLFAEHSQTKTGHIFQINPFGYVDLRDTVDVHTSQPRYYLLPQYEMEGNLYIGLRNLKPGQSLTMLFQMVSGSGDADLPNPDLQWSYLAGDRWIPLKMDEILADSTNGLLDSGIIRFKIPEPATTNNHLLPKGLHWLKASVPENALAIPDGLDICTQAVTATFRDRNNDPDHLSQPLAADSISSFIQRRPDIESVSQPYSSFGGRRPESDRQFYTRVSERLRHKQRALTRWDYEHLVLENFPQIYKVKCLTQAEQAHNPSAAQVTLVVIPNLANTKPFLPLEPKTPQHLLREIEAYLQARTSPFIKVVVKNPHYEQIKYRIAVRFRSTSDRGYYIQKLNEELVKFLSPWAYEEQSDISFGSSIHSSAVVHFVETRPYIDYVANLKLIEQIELSGDRKRQSKIDRVNTSNLAQVKQVDSILVSAPEHIIDLITTANYSAEEFEGLDYMAIGVDFIVT